MNQHDGRQGQSDLAHSQVVSDYMASQLSKAGLSLNTVTGSYIQFTQKQCSAPATGTAHLDSEPERRLWGPETSAVAEGQL